MGKFGNRSIPKFMKDENDMLIGEDSALEFKKARIQELQEGHSEPEIVSLGDADGGDFITITVKTVEGEEVALEFKLDDDREETEEEGIYKGTLSSEYNDVVYLINCEIEEAGNGDYDIKIGDVSADMGSAKKEKDEADINESQVLRFKQFIGEAMADLANRPKNRRDDDELPYFDHEPISEGSGCSAKTKSMIRSMCKEYLIDEGMKYHKDENESHTYDGYIHECTSYFKECMMNEAWR